MNYKTDDLRIESIKAVTTPLEVCKEIPITENAAKTTALTRDAIHNILHSKDNRLIVITGPCSIHDVDAAKEYAYKLKPLIEKYSDDLLIIMRVYFEKPRTTVGWKGLINDPSLDNSFNINEGLRLARQLLLDLNEMGVPAGTEYLDLDYVEDSSAEVDLNVVMTGSGEFVEIQGTGEKNTFTKKQLDNLIKMSDQGIQNLIEVQKLAIKTIKNMA